MNIPHGVENQQFFDFGAIIRIPTQSTVLNLCRCYRKGDVAMLLLCDVVFEAVDLYTGKMLYEA